MHKISVIIVTYNAMKWAERCFTSLRKSSIPVTTYVIDNGSTDGTQDYIQQNFPEVSFTQSSENLGFGKANNIGIEQAYKDGADFFYLMNQDAWLFEDSLSKLLEVYKNQENKDEIGILSPMHLNGTEKQLDIFLDKYIATNFRNRFVSDLYCDVINDYYEFTFINAAHWLLPAATVKTVGGFNPYFFHYGEDIEYVNRVHYHGKKVLLCPFSKVVHDGKQQLDKVDYSLYKDLTIETKMINPNYPNAIIIELKELRKSIFKAIITGDLKKYKFLREKRQKLISELPILEKIRSDVSQRKATFLNI